VPKGYAYGNARLQARRSRLLAESDYANLLGKSEIQEIITTLNQGDYKDDIEAALIRFEGVRCIFEALRSHLTGTLRQIRTFFEGEPAHLVDLLLRRWDRHNLLTILRGQTREVSADRIMAALIPVGQFDRVSLRELARQPSLRAALDLMTTWRLPYAAALRRAQLRAGAEPAPDQLELALNRFHYAGLQEALSPGNGQRTILREYFQREIDLLNLGTTLRLARRPGLMPLIERRYEGADARSLLIEPGGQLSTGRLAALVAEETGLEGIVRGLSNTRYGAALAAGWQRYQTEENNPVVLERELERWQARQTAALFSRNPLSIGIPIAYIGCKEIEIANLRLIAEAIALGLPQDRVLNDLIIV